MEELAGPAIEAVNQERPDSFLSILTRHIITGLKISRTGVFQDSYGGVTEYLHFTAIAVMK